MKDNFDEKTTLPVQFNKLFNQVWDMIISEEYILQEKTLPIEQQILASWQIVQNKLLEPQ